MSEDTRCCGSGTCIIDTEGRCWCGQQWDGQKMCRPHAPETVPHAVPDMPQSQTAPEAKAQNHRP
jgi:hypothetical protein